MPSTVPDHDELELIRRSGLALRVGRLSLSAGTGSYRVKASMLRLARAMGVDRHEAHVTLTEITTTSHRGRSFRTEVTEVRAVGINADRLSEIERSVSRFEAQRRTTGREVDPDDVEAELDRIASKPLLWPTVLNALWAGVACAAFAFLNHGGVIEVLGALVGAFAGQYLRRTLLHRGLNQFGVTMLAAALALLVYLGFVELIDLTGAVSGPHEAGYVSAVLFLVPGFPLVAGALDLARLDFSAGIARLTFAVMILVSAALAVWAFSAVAGLAPDPPAAPTLEPGVLLALRFVASFVAVLGFALMFNSPWGMALAAATVGMVANVARVYSVDAGLVPQAAAAGAALVVGVLAAWWAPRIGVPRVTLSVPAVVVMVPGVAAYRAVFHLSNGETTRALVYGFEAALVVVALSIGLAAARMLTDRSWGYEH